MKKSIKAVSLLMTTVMAAGLAACNGGTVKFDPVDEALREQDTRTLTAQEYTMLNLSGTDDFGRELLPVDQKVNKDRYVGLFYFLWLGAHNESSKVYDISEITEDGLHPEYFYDISDANSPEGAYHFWGKPVWGYYNSEDEWVIRKQVEMFTLAGVDFLCFDCTNNLSYERVTPVIFRVLKEYQDAGWDVPKVMYYLAYDDGGNAYKNLLKKVYNEFYAKEEYRSLWFAPDGKPIITMPQYYFYKGASENYGFNMSDPLEKKLVELFEFKCRQWPNEIYEPDGIPWMVWGGSYYGHQSHNGWYNVSVAQHVSGKMSDADRGAQGRSYDHTTGKIDHARAGEDLNYISEWQNVLDLTNKMDARFTFVTGWNEWIALKLRDASDKFYSVDTFNAEYSRDLEPSENLGDNAYLLTAQKIRENNFAPAKHYKYPKTTIDISKDDAQWDTIPAYVDFTGDCKDRRAPGYVGSTLMTDTTGRNDISTVKVARDSEYLYFRIETAEDITPYESGDVGWMNIWIKTRNAATSSMGYNYVLNRSVNGAKGSVSRADARGGFSERGQTDLRVEGNLLFVRVKLSDLGLGGDNYDIEFKVTDNVLSSGDYLDFYRTGDAAPIGRLNYRFGY